MTTTGQFRATPDIARNTAQFRAFTTKYDSEAEQPWRMRAPARNVLGLAAAAIAIAIVLIVVAIMVLSH
jgi:hypothetical protein